MTERPIYLDHLATTPCDPAVVEAMLPWFTTDFGNAASRTHAFGWRAEEAVTRARAAVGGLLGGRGRDVIFTSGATEANNLAILGVARAALRGAGRGARPHVVTCATEHRAVLDPCRALVREGFRVSELPVPRDGRLDPDALCDALTPDTVLVSLMTANNETGVLNDLAGVARETRARGILLHSDAAQAAGKVPIDVERPGPDLISLTAHKLYGPKGIGALWIRRSRPPIAVEALLHGGGHERGLRSGTLPVPLAVGFGRACELAAERLATEAPRLRRLRERLWTALSEGLPGILRNGPPDHCLPGVLNVGFPGIESDALLLALPELALSTGSACSSARPEPSHVLRALGRSVEQALSSVRFGLGRGTTEAEIDRAAALVIEQVGRLRALSPTQDARS